MKLVLDTNAYCLCETGHDTALTVLERASALLLPVISYGELYYGFKHGTRLLKNLRRLELFIAEFGVTIIDVDTNVARKFGEIYAHLRSKGRPIPTNDIWIGACCMAVGGVLLTNDRHFLEIKQIEVELL